MLTRTANVVMAVSIYLIIPIGLTGCDPIDSPNAPFSMRGNGESFEVYLCESIDAKTILLERRESSSSNQYSTLWKAKGSAALAAGSLLTPVAAPDGLDSTTWAEPDSEPGNELSLLIVDVESVGVSGWYVIPDQGLPTEEWLRADGTINESPCLSADSDE
jgi:hypothetical protein